MALQIKFRSDTSTNWSTTNPVLSQGEIGVDLTNRIFKIGNGTVAWNSLSTAPTTSPTQTIAYRSLGDGGDGNVTISSGTTTLVRDMYYNNLTINGTGQIFTAGFKIFVKGILDITAAPVGAININGTNGGNASGSTGGSAPAALTAGSLGIGGVGTVGANGTTTTGATATSSVALTGSNGGACGGFAAPGTSGLNAGGTSGGGATPTGNQQFFARKFKTTMVRGVTLIQGGVGGRGGSSGGGDGTNSGSGGGGGGTAGGVMALYVNLILKGPSTPSGVIQANGGNGGNGGTSAVAGAITGGGSGAGGAGGGWIYIAYNYLGGPTVSNLIQANGGNGGNGGNGTNTSDPTLSGGGGGFGGYGGRITLYNIVTQTGSERYGDATALINPEVTGSSSNVVAKASIGGTGSPSGLCQVSL